MQRFVLSQNIQRSRLLLMVESNESSRRMLKTMIHQWEGELACLNAEKWGAAGGPQPGRYGVGGASSVIEAARWAESEFQRFPGLCMLLDPGPGLRIIEVNDAYAAATLTKPDKVAGDRLFQVFPDNPEDPQADGVRNLYASLQKTMETGLAQLMAVQRYDVRDDAGRWVQKFWRPVNTPVFSDGGHLLYVLHQAQDVTDEVLAVQAN
jgi:PAS domain-containing protein